MPMAATKIISEANRRRREHLGPHGGSKNVLCYWSLVVVVGCGGGALFVPGIYVETDVGSFPTMVAVGGP